VFWLYCSSKPISSSEAHAIARAIACAIVAVQGGTREGFSLSDLILPCQSSFHQCPLSSVISPEVCIRLTIEDLIIEGLR
jgi:hypothetical protein